MDWPDYLRSYTRVHSIAFPIAWLLPILLGGYCLWRFFLYSHDGLESYRAVIAYSSLAAAIGFVMQILFVQSMGIPPFPRYFLPGLLLAGLALELLTQELKPSIRSATALFIMLITLGPSWSWARLRHSNVDVVARILTDNASQSDLVVISPWFLQPGFQLYYRGSAPWATVPDLPHQPMTRYDLFREAMVDPERERRLYGRIRRTLAEGGAVWFVSQSYPDRPAENTLTDPPALSDQPGGSDYVRFRGYWERAIIIRLFACCEPVGWPMPRSNRVWDEERLVLTLWRPASGQTQK
jgi:hypothetical protein